MIKHLYLGIIPAALFLTGTCGIGCATTEDLGKKMSLIASLHAAEQDNIRFGISSEIELAQMQHQITALEQNTKLLEFQTAFDAVTESEKLMLEIQRKSIQSRQSNERGIADLQQKWVVHCDRYYREYKEHRLTTRGFWGAIYDFFRGMDIPPVSPEGKIAIENFKRVTTENIRYYQILCENAEAHALPYRQTFTRAIGEMTREN